MATLTSANAGTIRDMMASVLGSGFPGHENEVAIKLWMPCLLDALFEDGEIFPADDPEDDHVPRDKVSWVIKTAGDRLLGALMGLPDGPPVWMTVVVYGGVSAGMPDVLYHLCTENKVTYQTI